MCLAEGWLHCGLLPSEILKLSKRLPVVRTAHWRAGTTGAAWLHSEDQGCGFGLQRCPQAGMVVVLHCAF